MLETYSISGSGSVRIEMDYDGIWDITAQTCILCQDGVFAEQWQALGSLSAVGGGGNINGARDHFQLNQSSPSAGSTSGTLVLTGTVSDGATLHVTSELLTQILEGTNGIVDFYRTAYLSVTFLDGAVGNPSDSRFLSIEPDRGQPSLIPLPASGLLLLGAFGGLALMRLRRRPRG
jgi:hypothetical protein